MYGNLGQSNSFDSPLTKDLIYQHVNSLTLMKTYLHPDVEAYQGFVTPDWLRSAQLRKIDKSPSGSIYVRSDGSCVFKDWGTGYKGDVFDIVQLKYNCNYDKALIRVAEDFGIPYYGRKKEIETLQLFEQDNSEIKYRKEFTDIRYKLKKSFSYQDKLYWLSFGIPISVLKSLKIFPVEALWINGELYYVHRDSDPCYVYIFDKVKVKAYFPNRKKARFITNIAGSNFLEGFNLLDRFGKNLIITKSYKDVAFIKSLDIQSVSPSSETVLVNRDIMDDIHSRFGMTYVLFDNDEQGEKMSYQYKQAYPFINQIFIPKEVAKDITDVSKKRGKDFATKLLLNLIE